MNWRNKQNKEEETFVSPFDKEQSTHQVHDIETPAPITTHISKDAKFVGDIISKENIEIAGTIKGNVIGSQYVYVNGSIQGTISSDTLYLEGASIEGNISCKQEMNMIDTTHIKGDIKAESLVLGGHVDGDLTIEGSLQLLHTAVVKGDIEASLLECAKGAVLRGKCNIMGK